MLYEGKIVTINISLNFSTPGVLYGMPFPLFYRLVLIGTISRRCSYSLHLSFWQSRYMGGWTQDSFYHVILSMVLSFTVCLNWGPLLSVDNLLLLIQNFHPLRILLLPFSLRQKFEAYDSNGSIVSGDKSKEVKCINIFCNMWLLTKFFLMLCDLPRPPFLWC